MKKNSNILIILLFTALFTTAQRSSIDSLRAVLKDAKEDTIKAKILNKIAVAYNDLGEFNKSIEYSQRSLELAQKLGYKRGIASVYSNLGLVYEYLADYKKSVQSSIKAMRLYEELNNPQQVASMYNNIGNVYFNQQNYQEAENYYLKAMEVKGRANAEITLSNLGMLYTYTGETAKSMKYFNMALEIHEMKGNKIGIADVYMNMTPLFNAQKDFEKTLSYYLKANEIYKQFNDKRRMTIAYGNIGGIYCELKKYDQALQNVNISLDMAKAESDKGNIQFAYEGLSEIYNRMGDHKKAYDYHLKYSELTDTLLNEETGRQIAEMNSKYESEKKDKELLKKDAEITKQESESGKQSIIIGSAIVGIILAGMLGLFILRGYREKQKTNFEILNQKTEIELKNKEIIDSIEYAKRIQRALLAEDKLLKDNLKEHFVLYKPKDIVSGDFYWAHNMDGKFLICTADCTGHGVPGAFMSLLNISFLNEVTAEKKIIQPDKILNYVRESIIVTLNTEGNEESQDGMDCTLCCFDLKNKKLEYAAANNSFYIIRDGKLIINPADKMPVGKSPRETVPFTKHSVDLQNGDLIYTLTDGYADQFGGPKGKKFKYKALEDVLLANHHLSMLEQSKILNTIIESWKGSLEQVDDVLVIGIKI